MPPTPRSSERRPLSPAYNGCLLCGSDETEFLFNGGDRLYGVTSKQFSVVKCRQCGLMRLSAPPHPEELAAYYPPSYWFAPENTAAGVLEEGYRRFLLRDHIAFVRRGLRDSGENGPVLDVGCGGGLFLGLLREQGTEVIGLDTSSEAAAIAWARNGVPAICGDLRYAPLPHGTCAIITMFHVVEHLADPRAYLHAAYSLLRPHGRLIVQVPDAACWQFALLGKYWNGVDVPRHLYDFRASDLRALLSSCGFEVVREKHFSWRDNPAGLATSIAPSLEPVARKVRRTGEGPVSKVVKDALYLALVIAAVPFAAAEAAFGRGSTVMIEARKTVGPTPGPAAGPRAGSSAELNPTRASAADPGVRPT